MAGRLVLHIGPLKTGTTYLQEGFRARREALADLGWLYPLPGQLNQERALWGLLGPKIAWVSEDQQRRHRTPARALLDETKAWDGPLLVSAEALCAVDDEGARQTVEHFPDRPVRIVITARELGGLIPSHATQKYKVGHNESLSSLMNRLSKERQSLSGPFWRMYDIPALIERWGALDAVDEVVVVTLPASGSAPGELWRRFAQAAGWDDEAMLVAPEVAPNLANLSPSASESRFLRTLSLQVQRLDVPRPYVHGLFTMVLNRGLLGRDRSERGRNLQVPPGWIKQVSQWAGEDIERISRTAARVVGDLSDLEARIPVAGDGARDESIPTDDERESLEAASAAILAVYDALLAARASEVELGGEDAAPGAPGAPAASGRGA